MITVLQFLLTAIAAHQISEVFYMEFDVATKCKCKFNSEHI